jgi:hypothetical protein
MSILLYLLLVFVTYDLKPVLHIVEVELYKNLVLLAASPRESLRTMKYGIVIRWLDTFLKRFSSWSLAKRLKD